MSTYAVTGTLYLSPTNATTGGTAIGNVEARRIGTLVPMLTKMLRSGLKPDMVDVFAEQPGPALFILRPRDIAANSLALLFSDRYSGGIIKSRDVTPPLTRLTSRALLIRPNVTTENYAYFPRAMYVSGGGQWIYDPDAHPFGDEDIIFAATAAEGSTTPGVMIASAANINSTYFP